VKAKTAMTRSLRTLHSLVTTLAAVATLDGCANNHPPAPANGMVMTTTIVVTNSGATNLIGYRLLISPDGAVSFASGDGEGNTTLTPALRAALSRDLAAAKPLAGLSPGHCAKSASFGTSTTIAVGGDRSPDISCPGSAQAQALESDITAIAEFLHVRNVPRGQGHELPPQTF
jgi:hypothetical protein